MVLLEMGLINKNIGKKMAEHCSCIGKLFMLKYLSN